MRNQTETERRIPWRLWLLCGGTLALFGAAAPASADSNFERGFERELGRILAHEAVNAGKAVLFQGVVNPYGHGYAHPAHFDRRDRRHIRQHRRQLEYRRWLRQQRRHHGVHPRWVRHGYYYDDFDDRRRGRKHRDFRRSRRHYDDCDD